MVLAINELQNTTLLREARSPVCPDCWADLRYEPAAVSSDDADSYRCTRCGAGWESNAAGWMFPATGWASEPALAPVERGRRSAGRVAGARGR
jgi:hypothetical protein